MATLLPAPCAKCGRLIRPGEAWVIGHRIPRAIRPDLTWDPTNWAHEHRACSQSSARSVAVEKNKRATKNGTGFFGEGGPREPLSPTAVFLPDTEVQPSDWATLTESLPWLGDLGAIPPDASPPRYITGRHPYAMGTYGPEFVRGSTPTPT